MTARRDHVDKQVLARQKEATEKSEMKLGEALAEENADNAPGAQSKPVSYFVEPMNGEAVLKRGWRLSIL